MGAEKCNDLLRPTVKLKVVSQANDELLLFPSGN